MVRLRNDYIHNKEIDKIIKRILLKSDCTDKQYEYMELYFVKHYTLREIANICGVDYSTVSRVIHNGLKHII